MKHDDGGPGTITELDPIDALGWISLDDGRRIRFGGTALRAFTAYPAVGTRVVVRGTQPGFGGALKAVTVVPLDPPSTAAPIAAASIAPAAASTTLAALATRAPRFSDADAVAMPCAHIVPAPFLPPHPLFEPWRAQITETAPTVVDLRVPSYRSPDPIEPTARDSFAHGRVAFLETPLWPSCGRCAAPLTMCVQLTTDVLRDFVPAATLGDRGLVALFCFGCGYAHRKDPRIAHVRLERALHRVVGPDTWRDDNERALSAASRRVTVGAAQRTIPDDSWLRARSQVRPELAASLLMGYAPVALAPPFPPGIDEDDLEDVAATYHDWLEANPTGARWGGARLGGVPSWDQADETPSCAHGEMRLLLDYGGEQFLDGALHVFACPMHACDLAFVAEF